MSLGETLTLLRKSKGLSQEQLAEKLDLTRQTISKWELDQSSPDIEYILELSEFFSVSTDYLLKGKPDTASDNGDNVAKPEPTPNLTVSNQQIPYKRCFYTGLVLLGVSFAGIIAFVIISSLHSYNALVNGVAFVGLPGFLLGTKTMWFFAILIEAFLVGAILCCIGILKQIKIIKKKK